MRNTTIIMVIILTIFFVFEAHAEQNAIRLICKYSHTIDAAGKSSRTTGEELITVRFSDNGNARIKKQRLGAEFIGKISDKEIYGETEYSFSGSGLTYRETLRINRYTGAFENTFNINKSKGLIHYGNCKPVTQKKF
jgi:hypothetical protein